MKKFIIILLAVCTTISSGSSSGRLKKDDNSRFHSNKRLSWIAGMSSHCSLFFNHEEEPFSVAQVKNGYSSTDKDSLPKIEDLISAFSLVMINTEMISGPLSQEDIMAAETKKSFFRPAWEITRLNLIVWAFDRYILKGSWTNISLESFSSNLRSGLSWDYDDFGTNHFGHAYHGALYHSIARSSGLSFIESSIYTLLGSLSWEFFWESERPGKNDNLLSTFGGMNLGEALFRIAGLVTLENSTGLERILRKSLKFFINPVSVGEQSLENHLFTLKMPLGAYRTSDNRSCLAFATRLEYKDIFRADTTKADPYDWFSFDMRIGINSSGIRDPELHTTGFLFGKKYDRSLAGLFGLFDYINSHVAKQMSAVGFGPGFVTTSSPESESFFNSSGVLSFVFGSSSASLEFDNPRFEKESNAPYHFGPGMLGRLELELGTKSLGSVQTCLSQYWVHSAIADADEFMSIISFDLSCRLTSGSQLNLGYDYYLRNATLEDQRFSDRKSAVRAMYVLTF
jgi:hypothetical protein